MRVIHSAQSEISIDEVPRTGEVAHLRGQLRLQHLPLQVLRIIDERGADDALGPPRIALRSCCNGERNCNLRAGAWRAELA